MPVRIRITQAKPAKAGKSPGTVAEIATCTQGARGARTKDPRIFRRKNLFSIALEQPENRHYHFAKWNFRAAKRWLQTKNLDRKSTRLNSSHVSISYAVFCL